MPTSVLIVDSSDVVRAGLRDILNSDDCINVIGSTADCSDARAFVAERKPDVIIIDLGVADTNRLELVEQCQHAAPGTRLLIFTSRDCAASVRKFLAAGVDGYLVKEASGSELIAAVKVIAAGRKIVSVTELGEVFSTTNTRGDQEHSCGQSHIGEKLSDRELAVLAGLARGLTNQQVAEQLYLSVKTIETYRSRLSKKIGARSRAELFEFAKSSGILADSNALA